MPGRPPVYLTTFVGQAQAVQKVKELLKASRLVTLTGPGGIGKTRLVIETAEELKTTGHCDYIFVDVSPVTDADGLLGVLSAALGLKESPDEDPVDRIAISLGSRRVLIVLDNCEQVRAHCAIITVQLLKEISNLHMMVTSREPLHVPGEAVYQVRPLALPPTRWVSLEGLSSHGAIQLFLDRARGASADFALTEENARVIVNICRALDGIPLALELAASWTSILSVTQILDQLRHSLDLVQVRTPTEALPDRHKALTATLSWSYQLLTSEQRSLWRRLAVFPADFDLDAATAIGAIDGKKANEVLVLLSRLIDQSAVVAEPSTGSVRYRLLVPIRQFCRSLLAETGEEAETRRRFRDWVKEQATEGKTTERDVDNLMEALDCSVFERDLDAAVALALTLSRFKKGFRMRERLAWVERVIALPPAESPPFAALLHEVGNLHLTMGKMGQAEGCYTQALELARRLGERFLEPRCIGNLGLCAIDRGDYAEAESRFHTAISLHRAVGAHQYVAANLCNLGELERLQGRSESAVRHYQEGLGLTRSMQFTFGTAMILQNLVATYLELSQVDLAIKAASEAIELLPGLQNRWLQTLNLYNLAELARQQRKYPWAANLLGYADQVMADMMIPLQRTDQEFRLNTVSCLRTSLGGSEYDGEWSKGVVMTEAEIQAVARAILQPAVLEAPPKEKPREINRRALWSLSAREAEVAMLVAEGLTDKEVAARLFISHRTVDTHLRKAFEKLGVSTRTELAVLLFRNRETA